MTTTGFTGAAFFGVTGATGPTGPSPPMPLTDYLYDRARIELIGASETMIKVKFYEVFHEFFTDSSAWQELIAGQLFANRNLYWLQPQEVPPGIILRLEFVVDNHWVAIPAMMPTPNSLRIRTTLSNGTLAYVKVIKTVAATSHNLMPDIPEWVVRLYEGGLLAGLLSKMQLQPNKPYTDTKLATINYGLFRNTVNRARVAALRANTFGTNSWIYPQNYRTHNQRGGISVGTDGYWD